MSDHLDLDQLADALAEGTSPEHLAHCEACSARLRELGAAMPQVAMALSALATPTEPDGLDERLAQALAAERQPATGDVLPLRRGGMRWMPALAAVAAAAVLVTGGVLVAQRGDVRGGTAANDSTGSSAYAVSASGIDYTRSGTELQGALSDLLRGGARRTALGFAPSTPSTLAGAEATPGTTAQKDTALPPAAADPLASLRDVKGLAACLASLTDPSDKGLPLALDYATFEGRPALVVVLPTSKPGTVDVFVVPPGCAKADGNVLYFRRLQKP
ncbi:MAG TPA: hypothetical protein VMZ11_08630 [Mycobacteriales bacterium]|nr:hypothetical protein [Mycobacteriales bacterium]